MSYVTQSEILTKDSIRFNFKRTRRHFMVIKNGERTKSLYWTSYRATIIGMFRWHAIFLFLYFQKLIFTVHRLTQQKQHLAENYLNKELYVMKWLVFTSLSHYFSRYVKKIGAFTTLSPSVNLITHVNVGLRTIWFTVLYWPVCDAKNLREIGIFCKYSLDHSQPERLTSQLWKYKFPTLACSQFWCQR